MAKFNSGDLLSILRKFDVATDDQVPRSIENVSKRMADEFSEVFSFEFLGDKYFMIVDGTAEDNDQYILGLLNTNFGELEGSLLENPQDSLLSFAIPFQGKDVYLFKIASSKRRLDVALQELHSNTSRSTIQKYIKNGNVLVNGKAALKPSLMVSADDQLTLSLPESTKSSLDLPVIYEDDNVIVVNKPAGVLTHSKGALNDEFTVSDFFKNRGAIFTKDTSRAGIVHRLDRGTSGVIIGAKTEAAAKKLQKQFSERTVKKTYFAIVDGILDQKTAIIDLPIARNNAAPSTFKVEAKGKPAQTKYEIVSEKSGYSLVKLQPKTGRTHQLRIHMAHLGTPIVGDHVYNIKFKSKLAKKGVKEANPADFERMYLHAESLELTIPPSKEGQESQRKVFTAGLPPEFNKLVTLD